MHAIPQVGLLCLDSWVLTVSTHEQSGNSASKTHGKVICGDGISWNPCWNTTLCHKKIMVSLMAQWNKYLIWAQNCNRTVWFWHYSYERYWSRVAQQMIFSAEAAKVNPLDLDPNLFFMNEWWMFHEYVLIYSRDIKTHMDKHIGAELIIKKNVMIATQNGFHQQSAMSFVQVCNTFPHDLFGLCADVVISIMVTFRWDIPQGIPLQQLWSICIYIYASLTIQLLGGCFLFVQLGTIVVVQLICIFVQMAWTHQPDNLTRYCHIA